MKIFILSIVVFTCIFHSTAQTDTIVTNIEIVSKPLQESRIINEIGVNINTMFLAVYGICIDYFITPNLNVNINTGIVNIEGRPLVGLFTRKDTDYQFYVGINYWFNANRKNKGFFPTLGLSYGSFGLLMGGEVDHFRYIAIPTGISYVDKKGFQASLLINNSLMQWINRDRHEIHYVPIPELKIGWRFKTK